MSASAAPPAVGCTDQQRADGADRCGMQVAYLCGCWSPSIAAMAICISRRSGTPSSFQCAPLQDQGCASSPRGCRGSGSHGHNDRKQRPRARPQHVRGQAWAMVVPTAHAADEHSQPVRMPVRTCHQSLRTSAEQCLEHQASRSTAVAAGSDAGPAEARSGRLDRLRSSLHQ
jgi:hypothetical protein